MVRGADLTGDVPLTGLLPPKFAPPMLDESSLSHQSKLLRQGKSDHASIALVFGRWTLRFGRKLWRKLNSPGSIRAFRHTRNFTNHPALWAAAEAQSQIDR